MDKIGLCVCYDTHNFGSQLQVLATIKSIEELGYDSEIILYKKRITPRFILQTIPRLFNPYFLKNKLSNRNEKIPVEIKDKISLRHKRFNEFAQKYFDNISEPYLGWENLVKHANDNYDTFLCGSDQLWLPSNLGSHFYTLEFAKKSKNKIAYATSFGVSNIPWFQKITTKRYLKRFNHLSTREIAGKKIIESLVDLPVDVVLDPTLLLDCSQWNDIIVPKKIEHEPYIFAYFLGTNITHRNEVEKLKEKTGLKVITSPFLDNYVEEDINFGDKHLYDIDASDFVNLIRYAEYIVTDSFHGSVFSIINHKKFMTFNRFNDSSNSRNSRIDSLCSLLGLSERRFSRDIERIKDEIDYKKVDGKIMKLRKQSLEYLKEALEN